MPGTVVSVTRPPTQDLLKRLAELWAEHRVDDGVEGGVEVSEPQEEAEDMIIDAVIADGTDESHHEERKPAYNEGAGNDCQGFCCLLLPFFLERNMLLGLLLLLFSFPLLLSGGAGEQGALVSLTSRTGMLHWTIPTRQ